MAKIRRFRCDTLKPFFSKQALDSYYHGILAATVMVDELNTNLYLDPGIEMSLDEYPYIFGILLIDVQ